MTTVEYNGVKLENVLTRQFVQTPVRGESETDIWYWEHTIRVQAIINLALLSDTVRHLGVFIPGAPIPTTMGELVHQISNRLKQDRGEFKYLLDGQVVVHSNISVDANNGPRIDSFDLVHITPETIKVEWGVKIAKADCPNNGAISEPPAVVSNRWSMIDDLDDRMITTRTIRGRLRLGRPATNPHDFRGVVVPVLQRGFRRAKMNFVAEVNAMELGYEIIDQEIAGQAAPSPAARMRGTHTETTNMGVDNIGDYYVRLDGFKTSDKNHMIQRAVQITLAKLQIGSQEADHIVETFAITDYVSDDECAIEVRARVKRVPRTSDESTLTAGTLMMRTIGKRLVLPDYDPEVAQVVGIYGTATTAGLFAAYLQTPCGNHQFPQVEPEQPSNERPRRGTSRGSEITYTEGSAESINPLPYNPEHMRAKYEHYAVDSQIVKNMNRQQLTAGYMDSTEEDGTAPRIGRPSARRIIRMTGTRIGDWPKLWKDENFTDRNGIKYTLLSFKPMLGSPEKTSMGTALLYKAQAEYVYAMSRAPRDNDILTVAPSAIDLQVEIPSISRNSFAPIQGDFQ